MSPNQTEGVSALSQGVGSSLTGIDRVPLGHGKDLYLSSLIISDFVYFSLREKGMVLAIWNSNTKSAKVKISIISYEMD